MLDPKDRVVMVSGAARGIGRAVTERLLASGFLVSAGVRDARGLAESDRLLVRRYDAESVESAEAWVAATAARFGRVQGLVNAAGINPKAKLTDTNEDALDRMWLVNVKGPLRLTRAALPQLRAAGDGRIVNLSSLSGKRVRNENTGYSLSKFAVTALTHAIRLECFDDGVRATALCPGFVQTEMTLHANFPREQMTDPKDLAVLAETLLLLPNNAVVAELLVNCRFENIV